MVHNYAKEHLRERMFNMIKDFSLKDITLTDSYYVNAFKKEVEYLSSFDTKRLLAGFYENAGLKMPAMRYKGWEDKLIAGHTLGHYLTAVAQAFESKTSDDAEKKVLFEKMTEIINGLKECQDAMGTGLIFGAVILDNDPEKQFDNVELSKTDIFKESWVPYYTLHKIITGLNAVANLNGDKSKELAHTALSIVSKLADWVYARTASWSEETHRKVLDIEYGGINDCLYDVYLLTKKEEHLKAAQAFDDTALFKRITDALPGQNALNNHHANTTIPKFMGSLKRYMVTGEKEYLDYAKKFWEAVAYEHSYITGGNSEWEHFGEDDVLDKERTKYNCETCNSYNMLKLTKGLFMVTGEAKYADWYENTFINSILASQNPATGMTTYFQPMASGYFKAFSRPFDDFWCCTGSGMENFSKLGESFFYSKDDLLYVNQYVSSKLALKNNTLTVRSGIPYSDEVSLSFENDFPGTLMLRIPDWAKDFKVLSNGSEIGYESSGANESARPANCLSDISSKGFAIIKGGIKKDTEITLKITAGLSVYTLPDNLNTLAFKYGPVVLSAKLGTEDFSLETTGVDVSVPVKAIFPKNCVRSESEDVKLPTATVKEFTADIDKYLVQENADGLKFHLKTDDADLTYTEHFNKYNERYGIYMKFTV